jgi:hypothetical protein
MPSATIDESVLDGPWRDVLRKRDYAGSLDDLLDDGLPFTVLEAQG